MRAQIQKLINERKERLQAELPDLVRWELQETIDDLKAAIRPQWVPVAERLPEERQDVFAYDGDACFICEWLPYDNIFAFTDRTGDDTEIKGVTHWHEIDYPEPPEVTT